MDIFIYAQINESNVCVGISQLSGEVFYSHMIPIVSIEEVQIGDIYDPITGTFSTPPPEPIPESSMSFAQAQALLMLKSFGLELDIETEIEMQIAAATVAEVAPEPEDPEAPAKQWKPGEFVGQGAKREFNGKTYIVRPGGAHVTQDNWNPERATTLWELYTDDWAPWEPGNLYGMGARVTHNGKKWISNHEYNHWEPGAVGVYTWDEWLNDYRI